MTSLPHSPLAPPIADPGGLVAACSEDGAPGSANPGNANLGYANLGGDLLRYLPRDRSLTQSPGVRAEASCSIPNDRLNRADRLAPSATGLAPNRDSLFLAAFAALLARLSGQDAVVLRRRSQLPSVITLAFAPETSFRSLLEASISAPASAPDRPCAIEFVFATAQVALADLADNTLRMSVYVAESETRVRLASSTGLWDATVLRLWLRYFDRLLAAAVTSPDVPWTTLPLLDPSDAHDFYRVFNRTGAAFPADSCVHDLITRWAEKTPDAIAIESEWRRLTYRELNVGSDAIAHRLQGLGAGPDRPVAICLERNAELPVALLGVLKSGSYYVPLDPQEAPQRLATILQECRPAAIVADRSMASLHHVADVPIVYLDEIPERVLPADALPPPGLTSQHTAYAIFTSGTTGKPKGVTITHASLVNLLHSFLREPGFTSRDRMLAVSPISFDAATLDILLPLFAGGTVVMADRLVSADPFRLAAMLKSFDITVLLATPPTWRMLQSTHWEGKPNLKMLCGGEALPRDLADQLLGLGHELWNCYGPTEATVCSAVLKVRAEPGIVSVGPPIANTTFYVLDETGRLLPPGVPGELYIGGVGVSPGYLDRPQLTKQRFLADPYAEAQGARMFRTGDLVRLVNGQEFEFFGRLDHQVKLRGYRIELGEIESVMRTFPGIHDAVAGLRKNAQGEPHLVAYFTALQDQPDLLLLRDHLSQLLPSYMLPSRFVLMDAMPLTSSGKVDRKTLLASDSGNALPAYQQLLAVKPQTELEEKLVTIFREVLDTPDFGVTDNFFDYGGYSLLTVRLFTRIKRKLDLNLPISLLFDAPTVRAFAEVITRPQSLPAIVPIRPRGQSAPLFVIHSYLLYGVLPQIVERDRPVYGIRERLDTSEAQTIEQRAAAYAEEILHVQPDGPIMLVGWCAAGSLTVDIARQIHALGRQVGMVALFDAEHPGYRPPVRGHRLARLMARLRFHAHRLRGLTGRQKVDYCGRALLHLWDTTLETLFLHHRPLLMGLQRVFRFSLPDAVFNNTWARVAAMQNFAPANYPGKIILFRATDVPQFPGGDQTLGWNDVAEQGVEVVFVPGDHESMFHDPHVGVLSRHLRQSLQLPRGL